MAEIVNESPDGKRYVYEGEHDVFPAGKLSPSIYKLMVLRSIYKANSYLNEPGFENYSTALRIVNKQLDYKTLFGISFTLYNFKFKKMLGEGSYGRVFEAAHPATGSCAIKEYYSVELMGDVAEVLKERDLLVYLQHERIVKIYGSFYHRRPYIVLEKCKVALSHITNIDEFDQVRFAIHLLEGLKYIHSKDIIHCDLKPANVLINEDNNLVICDFGCAICLPPGTTEWKSERILGCTGYSDYLVVKEMLYSAQNDIFAAACILFAMSTPTSLNYHLGVVDREVYVSNFEKGRRINYIHGRETEHYKREFLNERIKMSTLFKDLLRLMIPTQPDLRIKQTAEDLLECRDMQVLKNTQNVYDVKTLNGLCRTTVEDYKGKRTYDEVLKTFGKSIYNSTVQDLAFSRFYYDSAETELLDMTTLGTVQAPTILVIKRDAQTETEHVDDQDRDDKYKHSTHKNLSPTVIVDSNQPRSIEKVDLANETFIADSNMESSCDKDLSNSYTKVSKFTRKRNNLKNPFTKLSTLPRRKFYRKVVKFENLPKHHTKPNPVVPTGDFNTSLLTGCDVENTLFQIFSKLPEVVELKKNLSKPMLQWVPDLNKVMNMWQLASQTLNHEPTPMEELTKLVLDWGKKMQGWSSANEGGIRMGCSSSAILPMHTPQERLHTPLLKEGGYKVNIGTPKTMKLFAIEEPPPTKRLTLESKALKDTLSDTSLPSISEDEFGTKLQVNKNNKRDKPNKKRRRTSSGSPGGDLILIKNNKKVKTETRGSNPKPEATKLNKNKPPSPEVKSLTPLPSYQPLAQKIKTNNNASVDKVRDGGSKTQEICNRSINWLQCNNCGACIDERAAPAHAKKCANKQKKK